MYAEEKKDPEIEEPDFGVTTDVEPPEEPPCDPVITLKPRPDLLQIFFGR